MSSHKAENAIPSDWIDKIEKENDKTTCKGHDRKLLYDFIKQYYKIKSVASMSKATGKGNNLVRTIKMEIIANEGKDDG